MAANTCNQPPFRGDGTGAVADYVFGFEYINRADVEVYVGEPGNWTQFTEGNAANADEYQWQNATTIRLNAATGTDNVLITRETDRCDPAVEFFAGTSIRAEDLNANQEQALLLIQELSNTLSENGMDQPPGSDGITLEDLEDVEITTPANPSWLRWNGTQWEDQPILENGDAWVADDNHVVTAAAGDDRWLNATGGDIVGGDGITVTEAGGTVTINVDLDDVSGLEFDAGELRIDTNTGCEIVADGLNTETTAATIVQTGGTNLDPAIRVATTLGDTTTNNDLVIAGGANVTVTRTNDNRLSIAAAGGGGGGEGVQIVADVAALNDLVTTDPVSEPDNGAVILIQDSNNLDANAADGDNNQNVNGLPMTVADGGPIGGYSDEIQVTVQWDADDDEWDFIRWVPTNLDNRYINAVDGTQATAADRQNIRFNGLDLVSGTNNNNDIIGYEMRFANSGSPEFQINAGGVGGGQNAEAATFQLSFGDQTGGGDTHGCFLTAGDRLNRNGRIDFTGTNTGNQTVLAYTDRGGTAWNLDCDGDFETIGSIEFANIRPTAGQDRFTLGLTSTPTETYTITFPATAADEGTAGNVFGLTTSPDDDDDVDCALAWTELATAAQLDDRVAVAGDTMTGNLQMDGASVIADNGETVPNNGGNWDIQVSNVWQVADASTIVFPDNSDAPIPGQTGIFVCAGTVAGWTDANGGTWEHPGGTAQAGDANGVIIPFYVQTATNIILGTQTVGS